MIKRLLSKIARYIDTVLFRMKQVKLDEPTLTPIYVEIVCERCGRWDCND